MMTKNQKPRPNHSSSSSMESIVVVVVVVVVEDESFSVVDVAIVDCIEFDVDVTSKLELVVGNGHSDNKVNSTSAQSLLDS